MCISKDRSDGASMWHFGTVADAVTLPAHLGLGWGHHRHGESDDMAPRIGLALGLWHCVARWCRCSRRGAFGLLVCRVCACLQPPCGDRGRGPPWQDHIPPRQAMTALRPPSDRPRTALRPPSDHPQTASAHQGHECHCGMLRCSTVRNVWLVSYAT